MSPRVKIALSLYATGRAKSKKAAAEAVGISSVYVNLMAKTPQGQQIVQSTNDLIQDKLIDVTTLIEKLSRRGVEVIAHTMEEATSADLRFRAAQDLADRGSKTSKTQKIQHDNPVIGGRDLQALAEALVVGAQLRTQYSQAATGDYVKVDTGESFDGQTEYTVARPDDPVGTAGLPDGAGK